VSGLDGKRMRPVPGLVDASSPSGGGAESGPAFRPSADLPSRKAASVSSRARSARFCTTAVQRSAQNWHGQGESDCLIKTKHCDGPRGC
jgi:hypothetical protein